MKLQSPVVCAGVGIALLGGLYFLGCSSSDDDDPVPGDQTGKRWPDVPSGAPDGDGPGYTYAISEIFLGDTDWNGTPNPTGGWKNFGYNLDNLVTTKDAESYSKVCRPVLNMSPAAVHEDGPGGIDNSFGKNIMSIIGPLIGSASEEANNAINEGDFTVIVHIEALGDQPNYSDSLVARLYAGGQLDTPPVWDGDDEWPVLPELLTDPSDITSSKVQFPTSYVNNQTWVSGTPADITVQVAVAGFELSLIIAKAVITMDLNPTRTQGATQGIIAGVLETNDLIEELGKISGQIQDDLCPGNPTFETIANQVRQASDIMADGTQNPNADCTGISIGLGFHMSNILLGGVADPADPSPNPCTCSHSGESCNEPVDCCEDTLCVELSSQQCADTCDSASQCGDDDCCFVGGSTSQVCAPSQYCDASGGGGAGGGGAGAGGGGAGAGGAAGQGGT